MGDYWLIISTATLTVLTSFLFETALSRSLSLDTVDVTNVLLHTIFIAPVLFAVLWFSSQRTQITRLADRNALNWCYAAEGALNVAVRYRGRNKSLQGKVLRLRKRGKVSQIKSSISSMSDTDVIDEDLDPSPDFDLEVSLQETNKFVDKVMMKILTPRYVASSRVVKIDPKFIDALAKHIDPDRPEKRRELAVLHRMAGVGLLMKDSAQLPCGCSKQCISYCFEIKPKWGFLSTESKAWEVKRRVDRFTMHQHLKKKSSDENVSKISEYCPLDLFHGGSDGIRSSLTKLEKNPQNNLRLFVNGAIKFPNHAKMRLEAVLGGKSLGDSLFDAITESLSKEDVLKRILEGQTLGPLNDIESVFPIYERLVEEGVNIDIHDGYRTDYHPKVPPESTEDAVEIVKRFLISCTARDCSIMLTFSLCPSPLRAPLGRCCEGKWGYEITVVDLDSKPIAKMPHYYNVDREIAKNYTEQTLGGKKKKSSAKRKGPDSVIPADITGHPSEQETKE